MRLNKSFITNVIAGFLIGLGYFPFLYSEHILSIGLFALSGSFTNWVAIHMLFERVPGFYGSGVIPNKFQDFKLGIKSLVMEQFFTKENIEKFFETQSNYASKTITIDPLLSAINFDRLFEQFVEAIKTSNFGPMLEMFGGEKALTPLKEPLIQKIRDFLREMSTQSETQEAIKEVISQLADADNLTNQIDTIVSHRLDDLTPEMVKDIMQEMIRDHLGWLVVWGGVFGGFIGLIASFLQ